MAVIGKWVDDGLESNDVYVVINNIKYRIDSCRIIDAVDVCFKAFFALNIDFTLECKRIWVFIQEFFFLSNMRVNQPYKMVSNLINDLKVLASKRAL